MNEEHAAFLQAIIADPADDLPRLVYADYLDENDDADRAEFIRLQCGPSPEADARAASLLKANRPRWELPRLKGQQIFRRGFVEGVWMSAEAFVASADRLAVEAPITAVRLTASGDYRDAIPQVKWLARITELELSNEVGLGEWLMHFLAALDVPNLRSLAMLNNQLWPESLDALAANFHRLPGLTRLNLSGNPLGDVGLQTLAATHTFDQLDEFIYRCAELSFEYAVHANGVAEFAAAPGLGRLKFLDLNGHYVGDAGLITLAQCNKVRSLRRLDVADNEIGSTGSSGVENLVESHYFDGLEELNLGRNHIDRLAAEALANWPRLADRVRGIDFAKCTFGPDARAILEASPFAERFRIDPLDEAPE